MANLHQLQSALAMYTSEYDGTYPPAVAADFVRHRVRTRETWQNVLLPYLPARAFPQCPLVELQGRLSEYAGNPAVSGYAFNARLNTIRPSAAGQSYTGIAHPVVKYPWLTITILEARGGIVATRKIDTMRGPDGVFGIYRVDFIHDIVAQTEGARRHHGGANYAFADGHVKWLLPYDVRGDTKCDGAHPGFGL